MTETRDFPSVVIASISSGRVLCEDGFSPIHDAAEYLMGHPIWTHQFADKQLMAEMKRTIAEQCPGMPENLPDVTPENWREATAKIEQEFGKTVKIRKGGGLTALLPTDGIPDGMKVIKIKASHPMTDTERPTIEDIALAERFVSEPSVVQSLAETFASIRARTGAEGVEPNEAMINTMRGIILKNTWSNEDLVSHCRALLAIAQLAPTPPAGEAVERVKDAIAYISEGGCLNYDDEMGRTKAGKIVDGLTAALAAMSSPDERERAEREECAKIAENFQHKNPYPTVYAAIAAAIRARGPATEKE